MKLLGIRSVLGNDPYDICRVLNHVPRWSTVPVIRRQSVGEHCFLVARYALLIMDNYPEAEFNKGQVLHLALTHDDLELDIGDLPSPSKKNTNYDMPTLEHGVVKVADRLEANQYAMEEFTMGNKYMTPFVQQTEFRYMETLAHFEQKFKLESKEIPF